MSLTLRRYQQEAVEAVYEHLRSRDDNPCVELPTAAGKSAVIAQICRDTTETWGGRIVVLAHVAELLQQNARELVALDPDLALKVGIYSAGLGEKNPDLPITVAGIQSACRKAEAFGHVDLAIVDEAHLIPPEGEGMYRSFLAALKGRNPLLRVIGLTATPYRMTTGRICAPGNVLNAICYSAGVRDLMDQGYLCRLVGKSVSEPDTSGLHVRGGEFVADEAEVLMTREGVVEAACAELHRLAEGRKSVLVFCTGVAHGQKVAAELNRLNRWGAATIFGDTPADEREEVIVLFKEGVVRYLVNVNVLTTGFNAPNVDAVAMLRPTMSPGLYYQMVGRGFRIHPGKENCLVLDFGGNLVRHGPVDRIESFAQKAIRERGEAPWKVCPACLEVVALGCRVCPECGFAWPKQEATHDSEASEASVLSGEVTLETHEVLGTSYAVHEKARPSGVSRTLRVDYRIGLAKEFSEWVCLEHDGYAGERARAWWARRSRAPFPGILEEAVALAQAGALAETKRITVRTVSGEKYPRVVGHGLGERPFHRQGEGAPKSPQGSITDIRL